MAVQGLCIPSDEDWTAGEDRDPEPAIFVDEIPRDLLIRDFGPVKIPLLNCRSHLDPKPPVLPHQRLGAFRTDGLRGDLVSRKGDPVLREKLPRLNAGGSTL